MTCGTCEPAPACSARSVEQLFCCIGLLEDHLTQDKRKRAELYHDLDDLCGSWTEDAAAAFDRALAKQRTIDQDVWK